MKLFRDITKMMPIVLRAILFHSESEARSYHYGKRECPYFQFGILVRSDDYEIHLTVIYAIVGAIEMIETLTPKPFISFYELDALGLIVGRLKKELLGFLHISPELNLFYESLKHNHLNISSESHRQVNSQMEV